jgi:hypothetical protein
MTISITNNEDEMLNEGKPRSHYDQQYPAFSFRISSTTKEMLHVIKSELGKSWNQTFLHLIGLHKKKASKNTNFIFKKRK